MTVVWNSHCLWSLEIQIKPQRKFHQAFVFSYPWIVGHSIERSIFIEWALTEGWKYKFEPLESLWGYYYVLIVHHELYVES